MDFDKLVVKHVKELIPYQSARRIGGHGHNFLNANESPKSEGYFLNSSTLNRYPDCQPEALVEAYADYAGVHKSNVLVGRGSDEAIGLIIRTFCEYGEEGILIAPPTYGMYEVAARTNNAKVFEIERHEDFSVDALAIIEAYKKAPFKVKAVFIDSPANPLGSILNQEELCQVLEALPETLIVVDEAYIEFAPSDYDITPLLDKYDNLLILRTLSKAFALAGIRCGFALGHQTLIASMLKVIDPYPVCDPVVQIATQALSGNGINMMQERVLNCITDRDNLKDYLLSLSCVEKVFSSYGNYLLVKFNDGPKLFEFMAQRGIILRSFENKKGLHNCIRISIGSKSEIDELKKALLAFIETAS